MNTFQIKVKRSLPGIKKLIANTFPDYKGRKIRIDNQIPKQLDSYWDGGTKSYYCFYNIMTEKRIDVQSNHPAFEAGQPRVTPDDLPPYIAIVEHTIFCGKDIGIYIHLNIPEQLALPMTTQLCGCGREEAPTNMVDGLCSQCQDDGHAYHCERDPL